MKNKFFKTIKSTYLCVKYPFLYPRDRRTGKHYNNWKIIEKIKDLYNAAYVHGNSDTGFEPILTNRWKAICWRALKFYHDHVLQWCHCLTSYTEWDAIEPGWKTAFGDQLLKDLYSAMMEDGGRAYVRSVRILQIKEKWGRLEICLSGYGGKTLKVIQKYGDISWHTCISCGRSAVGYTTGWVSPYCHVCYYEMDKKRTEGEPKYNLGRKWFRFFDEPDEDEYDDVEEKNDEYTEKCIERLEYGNDEYTYGHNVEKRHYSDNGD